MTEPSEQKPRKPRKNASPDRPKLPPEVFHKAKEIAQRYQLPMGEAIQVATGTKTMKEVIDRIQLVARLEQMKSAGQVQPGQVNAILAGKLTVDEALRCNRLRTRKHESDYPKCHLADFRKNGAQVALALVEQKMQAGRILEETPFDIKLQPEQGDALEIHKHDVKFYFEAGEKKQILKQVTWGPAERKLPPEHFRKKKNRKDIKAIFFFGRQEEGKGIRWETAEGDQLRGKVAWLGRFEIVLELPKGQRVIMMRHAVVAAD